MGNEDLEWDALSVGATRPALVPFVGVPVLYLFACVIAMFPLMILVGTLTPALILLPILVYGGRWMISKDHNRPRVLLLAWRTGSLFGDRNRWGGITSDPLGGPR